MRAFSGLFVALAVALPIVACSYTLTDNDCVKYRDRLRGWATENGKPEAKDAADHFMKECPKTTISKRAHDCLERAGDEKAFFQCLN